MEPNLGKVTIMAKLRRGLGKARPSRLLVALMLVLLIGLVACGSSDEGSATTVAPGDTTSSGMSTTITLREYKTVDVQTAYDQLSTNEEAQLVDVREPAEWESTGVAPGAFLIPLGEIEQRAPAELAKDKPVYVICRSGNRSRTASEILIGLGFNEVYNVDGGMQAWIVAGLPVEPYQP
jgi:rhodanese-related sulfurtransferase